MKLKSFYTEKETVNQMKRQLNNGPGYFCVNFIQVGVVMEEGASTKKMPP